ncbi:hypothetical protein CAOG_00974 [Capsaspora owczarzaki ATCC 30864]|uniref:CCHC-type domain-containing protein n=1 Tax=Capsaspora owczarzaki (strain ATCC 30864) TaxID=595528 RepID=A0A0D2WJH9_CAPO3|nr:hypothetical protein CAOG_00974 [Capsaspora owczarzaki ATCC 30864]KJE89523.1 hypothetical protein CAOG_000974 [Capsaspora owczarzaki ATCC 30864]|eukprot:XP_004365845.1 hypothetical protein CAOG_00974 [Capsaspora owczarzaki ATCC 30864]
MADQPAERPRLKLLPKGATAQQQGEPDGSTTPTSAGAAPKSDPFGGARPREQNVSQEREARYREKEAEIDYERNASIDKVAAAKQQMLAQQQDQPQDQPQGQPAQQQQQRGLVGAAGVPIGAAAAGSMHSTRGEQQQQQRYQGQHAASPRRGGASGLSDFSQLRIAAEEAEEGFQRVEHGRRSQHQGQGQTSHGAFQKHQRPHHQQQQQQHHYDQQSSFSRDGAAGSHQQQHHQQHHQQQQHPRNPPPETYVCNLCHVPGHWIQDCEQAVKRSAPVAAGDASSVPAGASRASHNHQQQQAQPRSHSAGRQASSQQQPQQQADRPRRTAFPASFADDEEADPSLKTAQAAPQQSGRKPPETYVCHVCETPGHWIQECPNRSHNNPANPNGTSSSGPRPARSSGTAHSGATNRDGIPPPGYLCKVCNIPGHYVESHRTQRSEVSN